VARLELGCDLVSRRDDTFRDMGARSAAFVLVACVGLASSARAADATRDPTSIPDVDDEASPRAMHRQRFPFPLLQDTALTLGYVGLREGIDSARVGGVLTPNATGTGTLQGYGVRQVVDFALAMGPTAAAFGTLQGNAVVGLPGSGSILFGTGYTARVGMVARIASDDPISPRVLVSARLFGELSRGYDASLSTLILSADLGTDYGVRRASNALGGALHLAADLGAAFSVQSTLEITVGNVVTSPPLENYPGGVGAELGGALFGKDPSSNNIGTTTGVRTYETAIALAWDGSRYGVPLAPLVEASTTILDDDLPADRVTSDPHRLAFALFYSKPRFQFGGGWIWHVAPRRVESISTVGQSVSDVPVFWSADVTMRYVLE